MKRARQVCTFVLEGLLFGIDVELVQEVMRNLPLTPVPLSPPQIAGLINLRGRIVTAIDLRRNLSLASGGREPLTTNLVLRSPEAAVSLLVAEVGEVTALDEQRIEAVPEVVDGAMRELLDGVCQLPGRLLLLLDSKKVIAAAIPADCPGGSQATLAESQAAPSVREAQCSGPAWQNG